MVERIVKGPYEGFLAELIDTDAETGELTVVVDIRGRAMILRVNPDAFGSGDAGDREPRRPKPSAGSSAAAAEPDA
jgi:hypothetical protein